MNNLKEGYMNHGLLSFIFCPICIFYRIKEKITGINYNLDDAKEVEDES